MNIAALLALLLQTGVCAPTRFTAPDGGTLTVVVCPVQVPAVAVPMAPEPDPGEPA